MNAVSGPRRVCAAFVALLSGCLVPTGRTRGPTGNTAVACVPSAPPPSGASCEDEGADCPATGVPQCPDGATGGRVCHCAGSIWSCSVLACNGRDGGGTCPTSGVRDGQPCPDSLAFESCSGSITGCNGLDTPTSCLCSAGQWRCAQPRCSDAGSVRD